MTVPPDHSREVWRWLDQSVEDLRAACRLAADPEGPPRLAAFLAHLAAEKALKGALIARGVATKKIHDLVALQLALPPEDAAAVSPDDIDLLNPWNIQGRYPADLGAANRIVTALRNRLLRTERG